MSAIDVHAVVAGDRDKPAVVLSNSLGSTHRMWDAQVDALAEHFLVVRYDTRGHGNSPVPAGPYAIDDLADDVVDLLDGLGIERAHFVGLSLGGMTGMRLAARNPDRVNRLGLLCTAAVMGPAQNWTDRASAVRANGVSAIAEAVVSRWFAPGYLDARPDEKAYYESMVAATPDEGYAGCCEAIAVMDQVADLPSITAPTLAIAGADDPATGPDVLATIADGVVDGRLLVVPDAAHMANAQHPEVVTPAILEHLLG
ncbi:3-oxoadipate enol-lactonase [Gordonia hydrophobica]|uniref:3-oxoadipate enol-lactonase n=1 Tax=Gordonia hydrophobica TaxID=40516 RepID=A0ABZ2U4E0_9ACTN|nr:3-oxoadipate enol-lactonase [Gordonia hydrophobica]MBM7368298.1 3-oxoadipate enol-lactonase [Gordonia hydrophobica]